MITGQGLIGKLVYFLATKLLGRQIDISLDDRKRACRAFTELYFCIEYLEELSDRILASLNEAIKTNDILYLISELHMVRKAIDSLSWRFLELGFELNWALEIFDPVLAHAVNQLYRFKFSFLHFISDSIEIKDKGGKSNNIIKYMKASKRILSIDMESYYAWIQESKDKKISDPDKLDWPIRMLEYSVFSEDFVETEIEVEDEKALTALHNIIKEHNSNLTDAREKLREFLIKNFKVEEILFVSKDMQERCF
jgi:hypothetical protein